MKQIVIFFAVVISLGTGCHSQEKDCRFKCPDSIFLWPVQVQLNLPSYRILDSTRFEKENILNYKVSSVDSLLEMYFSVTSYEGYRQQGLDIEHQMRSQKNELESFHKDATKLAEYFKITNSIKVGYLKYSYNQKGTKTIEGKIFLYREKNLVDIQIFGKYLNDPQEMNSLLDCIFSTLKLK